MNFFKITSAMLPIAFATVVPALSSAADNPILESIVGDYRSVESDVVYGWFQQDCRIELEPDGRISFVGFPTPECDKVFGELVVSDDNNHQLRFQNGQAVWKNSYGDSKYFWVAAPDDPDYGYTVDVDEYITFDVDSETGVVSWEAPLNDAQDTWLRFMMVGGYYFDYNAGYEKVYGTFHFTDVKLYPVNAMFTATRIDAEDDDEIEPEIANKVNATVKNGKLMVSGLLNLNYGKAVEFDIDAVNGKVRTSNGVALGEFEDNGNFYLSLVNGDDDEIVGDVMVTDDGCEIAFPDLRAASKSGGLSAGRYTDCKLSVPFDVFAQSAAIESVGATPSQCEPEFYNLQGQKVSNPSNGIFIRKDGAKVSRVKL